MESAWRWSSVDSVGALLAGLRRFRKLTQASVARRLGVSTANVSRIEVGRDLNVSTFVELARAIGFEPMLVPKEAVPAVRALLDDMAAAGEARPERGRFVD